MHPTTRPSIRTRRRPTRVRPASTDGGDNPGSPDASAATDAPVVNPPRPEVAPGVQLSRGLIFYLPLDEGPAAELHDTSVNENRVRLVASDLAGVWVGGWRGMALRFSGTGGTQVQVESSLSLDTISDGFTIAFWYRRDNNRAEGTFLSRSAPMDRGCLYCADLVGDRLRLQINSPIVYKADLRTDQPVPVGRWIHLAFTYDQVTSATQIFVDGLPAARGVYAPHRPADPAGNRGRRTDRDHGRDHAALAGAVGGRGQGADAGC